MHAPDPSVLAHCVAIVLSRDQRDGAALMQMAEKLHFGAVVAFSPSMSHDRFNHRLVFYLVHFDFETEAMQKLLVDLRHAASVSLSFAPVVLFLREGSDADVQRHIEMGFDDVINVPEDGRVIATRLAAQIGREHLYIETRNYLGPDRHRLDRPGSGHRKPVEEHAELTILRTPEAGVHIVRRVTVKAR
jgi:PleD family two-component response regulator